MDSWPKPMMFELSGLENQRHPRELFERSQAALPRIARRSPLADVSRFRPILRAG